MVDITEAFVVSLGLDARNYKREIQAYRDDRKRLAEEEAKQNRASENAQKRMADGVRTLRNETVGFLFVLAGANSVRSFAADILTTDAATGRLARNLGLATEQVSAWEGAVKRVGGSAADIQGALRTMSSAFQSLQLTGTTGNDADLNALGVTPRDLQNPQDALLKISEASGRMRQPEFAARLGRMGLNEATINLLARGRFEVERMLNEQRKLGVATEESARAAQQYEENLARLQSKFKDLGRTVLGEFLPTAEKMFDWLIDTDGAVEAVAVGIGTAVVATLGWLGPLAALSGALAKLVDDLGGVEGASLAIEAAWIRTQILFHQKRADLFGTANPEQRLYHLQQVSDLNARLVEIADTPQAQRAQNSAVNFGARDSDRGGTPGGTSFLSGALSLFNSAGSGGPARVPRGRPANALAGNNPGGLNDGSFAASQPGYVGNNGRYAAFATMADGIAAQRALLASYVRRGYDTPTKIANRWAPRGDGNDPTGYAANIARQMGIGVNDRIGAAQLNAFQHAQAITENSRYGQMVRPGMTARSGAGGGSGSVTQTTSIGQIVIHTAATNAEGIARELPAAIARRGIVVQANTGLQP